jgi:hypothetical protein
MNELLGKTKTKGVVPMNRMILRNCKVTKEVVDRPSVLLPSFSLPIQNNHKSFKSLTPTLAIFQLYRGVYI